MAAMPPSSPIASSAPSSTSDTQSQRTLPCGCTTSSARWPMPKAGRTSTLTSAGSSSRSTTSCVSASASMVVHFCPLSPTYWRSSSQVAHRSGGLLGLGVLVAAGDADVAGHGGLRNFGLRIEDCRLGITQIGNYADMSVAERSAFEKAANSDSSPGVGRVRVDARERAVGVLAERAQRLDGEQHAWRQRPECARAGARR